MHISYVQAAARRRAQRPLLESCNAELPIKPMTVKGRFRERLRVSLGQAIDSRAAMIG